MTFDPLLFENLCNVRDLGGFPTQDGRTTRFQRYVRASGDGTLSSLEKERLYRHGVRTILDLRDPTEIAQCPSPLLGYRDIQYRSFNLLGPNEFRLDLRHQNLGDLYQRWLDQFPERFAFVFETLYEHRDACVLFHCVAGKDRTGVVAALLMGLAGCHPEDIVASYALSEEKWRRGHRLKDILPWSKTPLSSAPVYIRKLLLHVDEKYGGATAYLLKSGVRRASLKAITAAFVGPAAQ